MSEGLDKSSYEWHFLVRHPPRGLKYPRYIDQFRKVISESAARQGFAANLRHAALYAIRQDDADLIRQGIQCLAHVGLQEDVPALEALANHADSKVAADSKTCAFEINTSPRLFEDS